MSKAAAPPRSAPVRGKAVRNSSKVSGNVRKAASGTKSLKAKEEEYRKMNAELEAKTAELVKEAEDIVKGNLTLLCDLESSVEQTTSPVRKSPKNMAAKVAMETESTAADLTNVVLRMEQELDREEWNLDSRNTRNLDPDILPEMAEDMGPEALVRFLKAKLRVMQEEIDRLCHDQSAKERELAEKEKKLKELSDQNSKLQCVQRSLQPEVEKQKAVSEGLRQKCAGLEAQLTSLRKEVEGVRGGERKARSERGAVEVRLNRALEEVERQKAEIASLKAKSEDSRRSERVRLEELAAENKQLLRQSSELMTAFKKQQKLIDILKRQKMHIEAAKLLSFTEEEFVKALDWQVT